MAFAQQTHGGGPGLSHGPSANNRGATNSSSARSQSAASSSPQEVLTRNTKLDSTLTMKLQSKNLLPGWNRPEICLLWFSQPRAVRGGDSR